MSLDTYPLAIPTELLDDVRQAAQKTGLSIADTMRLSIEAGLPNVVNRLVSNSSENLKPLSEEECRRCWGPDYDDSEFDTLAASMVRRPMPPPEE